MPGIVLDLRVCMSWDLGHSCTPAPWSHWPVLVWLSHPGLSHCSLKLWMFSGSQAPGHLAFPQTGGGPYQKTWKRLVLGQRGVQTLTLVLLQCPAVVCGHIMEWEQLIVDRSFQTSSPQPVSLDPLSQGSPKTAENTEIYITVHTVVQLQL